jgi:hypothetical protein
MVQANMGSVSFCSSPNLSQGLTKLSLQFSEMIRSHILLRPGGSVKVKGEAVPMFNEFMHYTMMVHGGVDVYIHIFLTSALVGGEWSASRPGPFRRICILWKSRNMGFLAFRLMTREVKTVIYSTLKVYLIYQQ